LRRFAIRAEGNVKELAEAAVLNREIAHWGDKDTVFFGGFLQVGSRFDEFHQSRRRFEFTQRNEAVSSLSFTTRLSD
jgi:hypothetical protein